MLFSKSTSGFYYKNSYFFIPSISKAIRVIAKESLAEFRDFAAENKEFKDQLSGKMVFVLAYLGGM